MRTPLIAGNWKMFKGRTEAVSLVESLSELLEGASGAEALVCPPFTALGSVSDLLLKLRSKISLGAQNVYFEKEGAFTGEISPSMLKEMGTKYCIIGHSERRQIFGETDEMVNKKTKALLENGITPILCVGETQGERKTDLTEIIISGQVRKGLEGIDSAKIKGMVIAYEPIWAIGTGLTATSDQAQEVIGMIRSLVAEIAGEEAANLVRILYGGSVKPDNIAELMSKADIDGALVGGASLVAESFAKIVRFDGA